jgi:hypothetical protein
LAFTNNTPVTIYCNNKHFERPSSKDWLKWGFSDPCMVRRCVFGPWFSTTFRILRVSIIASFLGDLNSQNRPSHPTKSYQEMYDSVLLTLF